MHDDDELVLTQEEIDLLDARYDDDPIAFIEDCLWIQPKEGGMKRLILNDAQKKLITIMEEQRKAGKPVRVIILKARQIGFSTATQAYFVWRLTRNRHLNGLVLAHKSDASKNLFRMFVRYIENMPNYFLPKLKAKNEALGFVELGDVDKSEFDPCYGSRLQIESAENENAGRSGTYQMVHASEVAFWPYAETFLSLKQTVGNVPGTIFVEESTACGASGQYYEDWTNAVAGKTNFVALFVAWWEFPDYTVPMTEREAREWPAFAEALRKAIKDHPADWKKFVPQSDTFPLDEEEIDMVRLYPIDYGRVKWLRWCTAENCGGDKDKRRQEYPSCPEEAFIASGRPFFDSRQVINCKQEVKQVPNGKGVRYTIDEATSEIEGKPVIVRDPFGELTVWSEPGEGKTYAIGADVAEGTIDGDYDACHVVEFASMEHVAQLHGKFDPDAFGRKLYWLGLWYNQALLGVELNAAGIATVQTLEKYQQPSGEVMEYPNLWGEGWPIYSRVREHGWRTNIRTRKPMLAHFKHAFVEGSFKPRSEELLDEMLTFIVNEKGKEEAQRGKHDDLVMSAGIALQMREKAAELAPFAMV